MIRLLPAAAAVAIFTAACATPCQELAQTMCSCKATEGERTQCETQAEQELSKNTTTDADEAFCEQKITTCVCRALDTPQGKVDCGLAGTP